jgi:hypothetical protein
MTTKKTTVYRCPWCGNSKPSLIEDNGLKVTDLDLTLLCRARIKPEDSDQERDLTADDDGLVECAFQWCPNEG